MPPKKGIIEGANAYIEQGNFGDTQHSIAIAQQVETLLHDKGLSLTRTSLLDDTWAANNPHLFSKDTGNPYQSQAFVTGARIDRFQTALKQAGWSHEVLLEQRFVQRGYEIIQDLVEETPGDYRVTEEGNGKYLQSKGNKKERIKIRGKSKIGDPNFPSCQVLDTAIYEEKLRNHEIAITVLPYYFKRQQNETRLLLQLISGESALPVIVVYFDEDGQYQSVDSWSPELQELADKIKSHLARTKQNIT